MSINIIILEREFILIKISEGIFCFRLVEQQYEFTTPSEEYATS